MLGIRILPYKAKVISSQDSFSLHKESKPNDVGELNRKILFREIYHINNFLFTLSLASSLWRQFPLEKRVSLTFLYVSKQ